MIYATDEMLRAMLPPVHVDANKYSRGQLVVIAGDERYPGAGVMSAAAAQRAGAGYTLLYGSAAACAAAHSFRPSLVALTWERFSAAMLQPSCERHPMVALVGPGLDGKDEADIDRALDVIARAQMPVVADGGALSALAGAHGAEALAARVKSRWPLVVTPHGGEAARLAKPLTLDEATLQAPELLSSALALAYHAVVVLKGPITYISDGENTYCMDEGTPALAKAGTGDVLSGIIAALVVQGASPLEAGVLGATLHARAGNVAAVHTNERSVIPEDVIEALPAVLSALEA